MIPLRFVLVWPLAMLVACADPALKSPPTDSETDALKAAAEPAAVVSLSGVALVPPATIPNRDKLDADLTAAQAVFAANPDNADALIWVARRLGYLWRYHEAIAVLDQGIERWPDNPRLYRHRGHRHITVRAFDRAQADLERAAELIAGRADEVEPDGAPNPAGVPRTTLFYNIWYHLGLARYLQGDYDGALAAYTDARAVADNDDALVAVTDWMWMTLMRLGESDAAAALLTGITPEMDLLENTSYHQRLMMYQGQIAPEALLDLASGDATDIATQGYGVGNYHFVHSDHNRARAVFERIIAGAGWNAFGYIAAEADLRRMD